MEPVRITLDQIQTLHDELLAELTSVTERPGPGGRALKFPPGTEHILKFLAEKVVLEMLLAFINPLIYDKYKGMKTRKHMKQARSEIITLGLSTKITVDQTALEQDLVQACVEHGLTESQGRLLVKDTLKKSAKLFK